MDKKIIFIIIIFLFLTVLVLFFTMNKDEEIKNEDIKGQSENKELLIEDIEVGEGDMVEKGDTVTVHYKGMFESGEVFDSSYDKGRPFTFTIGQGRVIQGWEMGLEGMKEGGKRKLTIPPQLAYGEGGVRGVIPPDSTLIFEIELIQVSK